MTEEQKKFIAKTIQGLYLYPYYSKGENILRCFAWMASWLIGIAFQQVSNPQALGSAYFIFSLSLLLEFVPVSKTNQIARFIHGLFCLFPLTMFLGAFILIFENVFTQRAPQNWFVSLVIQVLFCIGWIVFGTMIIDILLTLFEAHKFFYDEEGESMRIAEQSQETVREQFMDNLSGNLKGGNT